MARISPDNAGADLARIGVEFHRTDGAAVPDAILAATLPEGERHVRGEVTMQPPAPGEEFTGVGAWHINAQDEAHLLRDGTGQVQFIDGENVITVDLEPGDVMVIKRAEHRFRALTPAQWILHYSGPDGADLHTDETGRASNPWPS